MNGSNSEEVNAHERRCQEQRDNIALSSFFNFVAGEDIDCDDESKGITYCNLQPRHSGGGVMGYSKDSVNTHRLRHEPISIPDAFTGRIRLLRCTGSAPRKTAKVPQQVVELASDMLDQGMSDFKLFREARKYVDVQLARKVDILIQILILIHQLKHIRIQILIPYTY